MRVYKTVLPIAVLLVLCALTAWQSRRLAAVRRAGMPEAYVGYSADVPPALNFVIVGLGGFRGIVAEVLWFRASSLQEEGRYLELVQLSNWITLLDPHAAEAWAYNAWNLAYNISVMMIRPEDRLRWVQNGIALLRDEGLRFNPREARLYRELAWLYQNKVGDSLDNAHLTYKLALASAMTPCVRGDGTLNDTPENRVRLAVFRLDADRMLALEKRFGPLDWRIAESHALYWAIQGVDWATGTERIMCRRGAYQPLMLSTLRGRFTGDLAKAQWKAEGNLALAVPTADYIAETQKEFPTKNMTAIYLDYLCTTTARLANAGRSEDAHTLYNRLLKALPQPVVPPSFDAVVKGWEFSHETN
jgi:hypothetical protein